MPPRYCKVYADIDNHVFGDPLSHVINNNRKPEEAVCGGEAVKKLL